jgi:hypothetical protein
MKSIQHEHRHVCASSYLKTRHQLHVLRQAAELIVVQQQFVKLDVLQYM